MFEAGNRFSAIKRIIIINVLPSNRRQSRRRSRDAASEIIKIVVTQTNSNLLEFEIFVLPLLLRFTIFFASKNDLWQSSRVVFETRAKMMRPNVPARPLLLR